MIYFSHDVVEQAWELLRVTPPFKRWKLPRAEEIEFHVVKTKNDCRALYEYLGRGRHRITINTQLTPPTLDHLLQGLAHEAAHLRHKLEYPNDKAHHGKHFQGYAKQICRHHSWPIQDF